MHLRKKQNMKNNPYTLLFGKKPTQIINRIVEENIVLDAFTSDTPSQQVFVITGVRGSGKTVFLTEIAKKLSTDNSWIIVELNPERNMLESLVSKLGSEMPLAKFFKSAKINLSFFGVGLEVKGEVPITDVETALSKMISSLKNHNKRLLITIDEAVNTANMREFVSAYQIFVRQDLPVFLLMTGLYDHIDNLQNEKNLTFLHRAPKIELQPLNLGTIAENYLKNFEIDPDTAHSMALLTKGYSFAFQVLGYFTWENTGTDDSIMTPYRQYLEDYVYDKIWSELSFNDKKVLYGIAKTQTGKISEIRDFIGIETNQFNPYRKRLIRKGLIKGDSYGYVSLTLPLFDKFILENYE